MQLFSLEKLKYVQFPDVAVEVGDFSTKVAVLLGLPAFLPKHYATEPLEKQSPVFTDSNGILFSLGTTSSLSSVLCRALI